MKRYDTIRIYYEDTDAAHPATPGAWPKQRHTWSIMSFRRYRCGNGGSKCPNGRATSFSVGGEVNGRCTSVSRRSSSNPRNIVLAYC